MIIEFLKDLIGFIFNKICLMVLTILIIGALAVTIGIVIDK
jgi:hypothetical protein